MDARPAFSDLPPVVYFTVTHQLGVGQSIAVRFDVEKAAQRAARRISRSRKWAAVTAWREGEYWGRSTVLSDTRFCGGRFVEAIAFGRGA